MNNPFNFVILALVSVIALIFIYFIFKKDTDREDEGNFIDKYSINYLSSNIKDIFNEILNQNIAELYLNKKETIKREHQKARLNKALRSCASGNIGEKEYIKDYIKDILQQRLDINENTIDKVISFENPENLSVQDKFEILLYQQKKLHKKKGFEELNKLCHFDKEKQRNGNFYYEVTDDDINVAYDKYITPLGYIDKLELITQRIYQETYGFSVIDEIRDMSIDGVSGGVSGVSTEQYYYMEDDLITGYCKVARIYDSVWIFLHGKAIHLSCLSFGSESELIRVCKNLYMYDNVGHLTSSKGYKLTYMHDSSRVVIVRPNLTPHWAFFVRKFDSAKSMTMDWLVRGKNKDFPINITKWATKGCLNFIISGDQNSGKTTYLRSIMGEIDSRYPIRTTEQDFELWLANTYPELNVQAFRETEEVDLMTLLGIEKKTDGTVMILGEVNSPKLAEAFISNTQAGTKMCICTIHTLTAEDGVDYLRNSILSSNFTNEMIAEEQVANALHLDIHWVKTGSGERYISRITEIIPYERNEITNWPKNKLDCIFICLKTLARKRAFTVKDLVVYENSTYVVKNAMGDRLRDRILRNLDNEDQKEEFINFCNLLQIEANKNTLAPAN